jgi:hypothetical protein
MAVLGLHWFCADRIQCLPKRGWEGIDIFVVEFLDQSKIEVLEQLAELTTI